MPSHPAQVLVVWPADAVAAPALRALEAHPVQPRYQRADLLWAQPGGPDLTGIDAVWLLDPPAPVPGEPMYLLYQLAQRWGLPVVATSGAFPDPQAHRLLGAATQRAAARAAAADNLRPRNYLDAQRGVGWNRLVPIGALLLLVALFVVANVALGVVALIASIWTSPSDLGQLNMADPATMIMVDLLIAVGVPAAVLATWTVFRRGPWRILSVEQRMRWRWLAQSLVWISPLWVLYLACSWWLSGQESTPRAQHWVALTVITLILTPWQCAGEELIFRGALPQALGSYFRRPLVALGVSSVISASLFALAHGSLDLWILLEIGSFALAAHYLAWRTGGLEAGLALHIVNNVLITISGIFWGGLEASYVGATTQSTAVAALAGMGANALATGWLIWRAQRAGIAPSGLLTPATSS